MERVNLERISSLQKEIGNLRQELAISPPTEILSFLSQTFNGWRTCLLLVYCKEVLQGHTRLVEAVVSVDYEFPITTLRNKMWDLRLAMVALRFH